MKDVSSKLEKFTNQNKLLNSITIGLTRLILVDRGWLRINS